MKRAHWRAERATPWLPLFAAVVLLLSACGGADEEPPCTPGDQKACTCPSDEGTRDGETVCLDSGSFDACDCSECAVAEECEDDDPCTYSVCAEGICEVYPFTGTCDDQDPCTIEDACTESGQCIGAVPLDCDDGDTCTEDSCDDNGCRNWPIEGCCHDDTGCGFQELCIDGLCAPDPEPCGDGAGLLPDGLTEIFHDDGSGEGAHVAGQDWTVTDLAIPIGDTTLNEAVRFELEHPAVVHGFKIRWGIVPQKPDADVVAGLYPDFGYNGFDFWQADPYWEGSRCAVDATPGEWTTYALPEGWEFTEPGLVYVAHQRHGVEDAAWLFDLTTTNEEGTCGGWDDCHSSLNFPLLTNGSSGGTGFYAWNGLSMQFQYDYMVRLLVEYTEELPAEQTRFQRFQPEDGEEDISAYRAAWGDYDDDGDEDLLAPGPKLWRNDGGTLVDATGDSGIGAMGISSSGGVWGDYDNDGCLDIFLFQESQTVEEVLLRSACDGTFEDVTFDAGIYDIQLYNSCGSPETNVRSPTPAAAWLDVDSDGFLDLYLANMLCWSDYSYFYDTVWHNEGNGTFSEWTGQYGFMGENDPSYAGRGANPIDADQDGDVDLYVNNYVLHPNLYYQNNGDGTVVEAAAATGVAGHPVSFGGSSSYGHSIGAAWGDLDNDADFDLVVANLAHPRFWDFSDKTMILMQQPDGTFQDIQGDWSQPEGAAGLRFQETHSVPALADFDQDGVLDLVITATYGGRPTDYYRGLGDGTFQLESYRSGLDLRGGWGVAWADLDLDGDPDLITSGGLYINETPAADKGHWLQLRAVGNVTSNYAALGATIRVTTGDVTRIRHVGGGTGQGCQDSLTTHFGLGDAEEVDAIVVSFPAGETVTYTGPFPVDQGMRLFEDGTTASLVQGTE